MANIRITLKETGQQSIARLWIDKEHSPDPRLNVREELRKLRLHKKYRIKYEEVIRGSSGLLYKGSYFFEYITKENILLVYEKTEEFIPSFIKYYDEKKKSYIIYISEYGSIYCKSEEDRDVLYDFLLDINIEKYWDTNNKVYIKDRNLYTYSLLYNNLEKIKAELINKRIYNSLSHDEKIILEIPLSMWGKTWRYGAIFLYNWFIEEGDIIMDDTLFSFLDKWEKYKEKRKKFFKFINSFKHRKIKDIVSIGDDFRLYPLKDIRMYISKNNIKNILSIQKNFQNSYDYTNFSRLNLIIGKFENINDRYIASFGTIGFSYVFEGEYNPKDDELKVFNIWELINDGFDFDDSKKFMFFFSQPLGVWDKSIFKPFSNVSKFSINPISESSYTNNETFTSFKKKTGIGKDYRITGIRVLELKDKFISRIKINKDFAIYE